MKAKVEKIDESKKQLICEGSAPEAREGNHMFLIQIDSGIVDPAAKLHKLRGSLDRFDALATILASDKELSSDQRYRYAKLLQEAHEIVSEELQLIETLYNEVLNRRDKVSKS